MRTDGHALRGNEMAVPYVDLESVKGWANRTFAKERIVDAAMCVSPVRILGMVLSTRYRVMEYCAIVGF